MDLEPLLRELVGAVLRDERRRQSRTLAQVAATAGVSMQHLSDIERGRKDPSSELLAAVTGALEVSVPQLLLRAAGDAPLRRRAQPDERADERFRGPALLRPTTVDLTPAVAGRSRQRAPGSEVALAARPHLSLLSAA